jgi:uncharacterized protein YbaP (TraB family)
MGATNRVNFLLEDAMFTIHSVRRSGLKAVFSFTATVALLTAAAAQAAPTKLATSHADAGTSRVANQPAMWVVRSPTATIYLFGTIHALTRDVVWRTPAFDEAYAKARVVWFETDSSDPNAAKNVFLRYAFDVEHPLSARLDANQLAALKAILANDNLPFSVIDRMRPWAAAVALSTVPTVRAGLDVEAGADTQLTLRAAADHKEVRSFETLDQQMHFFADLRSAAEIQLFEQVVHDEGQTSDDPMEIETAWLNGDLQKLGPLLAGEMRKDVPELYRALIRRRNQAWSEIIAKELAGTGTEMVIVGAFHMVGTDGLPATLRARGFTVERIQ